MPNIPKGWTWTTLGKVCSKPQYGWTAKANKTGALKYLRTSDISGGKINWETVPYCQKRPPTPEKYKIYKNDILVSRAGSVGISCLIEDTPIDAVFASYLIRFKTLEGIVPKYVGYFLKSHTYWRSISDFTAGIAIPNVNASKLSNLEIPLTSQDEQHRIVAKLEKLLAKVKACQERLNKIPAILKRFRQSVLAAACSGRLTADWREENFVDDEWPVQPLGKIFNMRNGKSLTAIKRKYGDIPVYGGNGFMGMHNKANTEGQVIVIGRVGAQCGNVHYVSGKVWVTDNAISLLAQNDVVPAFYAFFLRSRNLHQLSGGTGQPYVSQEILAPLETPVVSITEQHEIVRRVEALFKITDQIEERYKKVNACIERLTQSILAKAFCGELVAQVPYYKPTSVPLKKMRESQSVRLKYKRNVDN